MKRSISRREFESDEEDGGAAGEALPAEKKRRLRVDQVKALERSFELENKLEPERKVQLAMELGLDPRQVAIWFQNRRARWKTKQLERDYNLLQSEYDEMKVNYDVVKRENETLIKQIAEMKAKLGNRDAVTPGSGPMVKEELIGSGEFGQDLNFESAFCDCMNVVSSDSATSGVVSEDNSPQNVAVSSSSMMLGNEAAANVTKSPELWPETYSFFAGDEEPAPMFNWYCPDPWN